MTDPLVLARSQARARIVETAELVIAGKLDVLEGARELLRSWNGLVRLFDEDGPRDDRDYILLVGVDSELDRFPLGEERKLWAVDSLAELDPEIGGVRQNWEQDVMRISRRLSSEFADDPMENDR